MSGLEKLDKKKYLCLKLKQAREELDLTQAQAGEKLGKDETYISKVELGFADIDIFELVKFMNLYNKDLSYFVKSYNQD